MHDTIDSFDKAAAGMQELVHDVVQTAYLLGCEQRPSSAFFHPLEYECDTVEERVLLQVSYNSGYVMGRGRTMIDVCPPLSETNGFLALRVRIVQFFNNLGRTVRRLDVVRLPENEAWGLIVGLNRQ